MCPSSFVIGRVNST